MMVAQAELRGFWYAGLTHALRRLAADARLIQDSAQDAPAPTMNRLETSRGDSRLVAWALSVVAQCRAPRDAAGAMEKTFP